MKVLAQAERLARWMSNALLILAAVAILLMMLHIVADVVGRYFFDHPVPGTMETTTIYYMVAVSVLPWAYVTQHDGQIVVELFTSGLSRRNLAGLQVLVGLLTFVALAVLAWMTGVDAVAETVLGEVRESGTMMILQWPSRWFLPAGSGLSAICVLLQVFHHLATFLGKGSPAP